MSRAQCGHTGRGSPAHLLKQEGTAVDQSTGAPTSNTSTQLTPRPTMPRQKLTARPVAHDLDWDHIPTARTAAGSYTRESLDAAIKADASDSDRWLPKVPGQRRSPEQPTPKVPGQRDGAYDTVVLGYGVVQADAAFGGAA